MYAQELERILTVINDYRKRLHERTEHHMGYPYNLDFDFSALEGLQKFSINNLGDPFIESNYGVHSREFEVTMRRRQGMPSLAHCRAAAGQV